MITVNAYGKINLTLDIVGKQKNYHLLDMIVSAIELSDTVTIIRRKDNLNYCIMDGVQVDESNSAMRAIYLMKNQFNVSGFEIYINKSIPFSGGLGGSTADGVAVIKGIAKLLDIPRKKITNEFLLKLGSDAPCMYDLGVKRVQGIGEKVTKLGHIWSYNVGIIAGSGVDTAKAYALFDSMNLKGSKNTLMLLKQLEKDERDINGLLSNDLYLPAVKLNCDIKSSLEYIKNLCPIDVNMSGSGSSVYGLFKSVVPADIIKTKLI